MVETSGLRDGSVNQELFARNEYLAAENRILRAKLPPRLQLSNSERTTLDEIGKRLRRKAIREVASVAKPDTILAWYGKRPFHLSRFALSISCSAYDVTFRRSLGWER